VRRWRALFLIACTGCSAKSATNRDVPIDAAIGTGALLAIDAAGALFQRSYDAEAAGQFLAALDALDQLPEPTRLRYVVLLRRGWLLYRAARYAEAVTAYRLSASREPASIEARVGLLSPLHALEEWKELEHAAEDVLDRDPENYAASYKLAIALVQQRRFAEGEAAYRKLLQRYPADDDLRSDTAWSVVEMGRPDAAAVLFREVLEVAPGHVSALRGLRLATDRTAR
jgi:tetratricopeptide (TPR) repeat protein